MKNKSKIVGIINVILVVYVVLYAISQVGLIICVFMGQIPFLNFISLTATLTISLFLLFGLNYSLNTIEKLKELLIDKNIIESEEINTVDDEEEDTEEIVEENIKICSKCGYQLFPEDEVCPNCGEKVKERKN